jgi:hypothetical protein
MTISPYQTCRWRGVSSEVRPAGLTGEMENGRTLGELLSTEDISAASSDFAPSIVLATGASGKEDPSLIAILTSAESIVTTAGV